MAQFLAAGLVATVVLAVATSWLSQQAATDEAVTVAEDTTELVARSVLEPNMPRSLLDGDIAVLDRFDRFVRREVLVGDVLRVKLWAEDGTIVYSDRVELIGEQFELDQEEREALNGQWSDAEVSTLSDAENRYERAFGERLLEVYTGVTAPDGTELLFEVYYAYDDVETRSDELVSSFRPITIGGLVLFLALTVPLVWVLARRLSTSAADRERLLRAAVDASDAERRRIARDLHDGVVQDLAGTSFALSATARDVTDRPETARRLDGIGAGVRNSLRSLRSLLVEIYPPDLRTEGLAAALDDLVTGATAGGVEVDLQVPDTSELRDETVALVWRVAQEVIRNAVRHGAPSRLSVRLCLEPADAPVRVLLLVQDDGRGFDPADTPARGHLGLRALRDLVRDAGGTLDVDSRPGAGTRVRLEVPA